MMLHYYTPQSCPLMPPFYPNAHASDASALYSALNCHFQEEQKPEPEKKISIIDGTRYKFYEKGVVSPDGYRKGGTTSGIIRYPHLIEYLRKIKKKEFGNEYASILVLGPGLEWQTEDANRRVSSPHLHEILAAFSPKALVTIVDINDFLFRLDESCYGPSQKTFAENILSYSNRANVSSLSFYKIRKIKQYIKEIPENVTQHLDLVQQDFSEFDPQKKYDYIFATQSLMYAVQKVENCRELSLKIIGRYLGSLNKNGRLFIDEILYKLMRKTIENMPNPNELENIPLKFSHLQTFFEVRKIAVPNESRQNPVPVLSFRSRGKNLCITTANIYCIKRLASSKRQSDEYATADYTALDAGNLKITFAKRTRVSHGLSSNPGGCPGILKIKSACHPVDI